jgi:hypothetical protein
MIFCSSGRFQQLGLQETPPKSLWSDTASRNKKFMSSQVSEPTSLRAKCYAIDYDVNNIIDGRTMAFTTASDDINWAGYVKSPRPKKLSDFSSPRPEIAFSIDICTWFLHTSLQQNWPVIGKDMITQTQQPGFQGGIKWYATPFDGLRNLGLTMLHEVRLLVALQHAG